MESHDITGIIIVLGTCVILPITEVFLILRAKIESEKNRKEIILAALEKNADINIEDLVKQMNKPEKLIKEKLLKKLLWGMLTFFLGIGLIGYGTYLNCNRIGDSADSLVIISAGLVMLAVGIAFLANYHIGKKMLAKEMEAEEQNMKQK